MYQGDTKMKEVTLLTWLTQLGLSVAFPLAGFIFLALWFRNEFDWGNWVLWVGVVMGLVSALNGLLQSLKMLASLSGKKSEEAPPVSYNDHD